MTAHALKLCYIEHHQPWAYFTTQALEDASGDDWEKSPYEWNSEPPDRHDDYARSLNLPPWTIVQVAFDAPLNDPATQSRCANSPWSVRDINRGAVPWLRSPDWRDARIVIPAGVCLCQFARLVRQAGGVVYLPPECPPCEAFGGNGADEQYYR